MKKILITGATGMLGSVLVRILTESTHYDVYGLSRTPSGALPEGKQFIVDLVNSTQVARIPIRPDVIIHTAAVIDLNACEKDPTRANLVNVEGTRALTDIAGNHTLFIYISTDSVFDGVKGNYSEADHPNPLNAYSRSKYEGEIAVLDANPGITSILRTNIYGFNVPPKGSLAEWAYREWLQGKKICGFSDIVFNAVFTHQLADIIRFIVDQRLRHEVLNVGSNEAISKYEFLKRFRSALGVSETLLEAKLSTDFPSVVQRPRDTSLNTSLLSQFYKVPDFDSGIQGWINHAHQYLLRNNT